MSSNTLILLQVSSLLFAAAQNDVGMVQDLIEEEMVKVIIPYFLFLLFDSINYSPNNFLITYITGQ